MIWEDANCNVRCNVCWRGTRTQFSDCVDKNTTVKHGTSSTIFGSINREALSTEENLGMETEQTGSFLILFSFMTKLIARTDVPMLFNAHQNFSTAKYTLMKRSSLTSVRAGRRLTLVQTSVSEL